MKYVRLIFGCFAVIVLVASNTGCTILVPATAATTGIVMLDTRSTGTIVDDNVIMTKIKGIFAQKDFGNMLAKIAVNVHEGRVMLTGTVKERRYIHEAVKIAWSVSGVKEVIDELRIAPRPKNKATDALIANQIKARYLLEKRFDSVNYVVDANDGVVYLLGIAQDKDELSRAITIASEVRGVEKVVNHVLLKNDMRRLHK